MIEIMPTVNPIIAIYGYPRPRKNIVTLNEPRRRAGKKENAYQCKGLGRSINLAMDGGVICDIIA